MKSIQLNTAVLRVPSPCRGGGLGRGNVFLVQDTLSPTRRRRRPFPTPANAIRALAFVRFNNTISVVEKNIRPHPTTGEGADPIQTAFSLRSGTRATALTLARPQEPSCAERDPSFSTALPRDCLCLFSRVMTYRDVGNGRCVGNNSYHASRVTSSH